MKVGIKKTSVMGCPTVETVRHYGY